MSVFNNLNQIYRTSGTIDGPNQEVTLQCPGAAGAIVTFNGTFTGTLVSVGGTSSIDGGRFLFKSGVGSVGTNKIEGDGTLLSREYRIIAGGDRYSIKSDGVFTGSVNIEIISSNSTNTVFGNGPFHNSFEEAIRDGRGFLTTTGIQPVSAGNIIACKLFNPSNSGVNIFIKNRLFGNNVAGTAPNLEYVAYSNPTITTLSNINNGINLKSGSIVSAAEFSWDVDDSANITMGGIQGSGEVLPRGESYSRPLDFMMTPGNSVGYTIDGAGNNLTQAARLSIVLEWYEETIN